MAAGKAGEVHERVIGGRLDGFKERPCGFRRCRVVLEKAEQGCVASRKCVC